jgi:hypothetical protein
MPFFPAFLFFPCKPPPPPPPESGWLPLFARCIFQAAEMELSGPSALCLTGPWAMCCRQGDKAHHRPDTGHSSGSIGSLMRLVAPYLAQNAAGSLVGTSPVPIGCCTPVGDALQY